MDRVDRWMDGVSYNVSVVLCVISAVHEVVVLLAAILWIHSSLSLSVFISSHECEIVNVTFPSRLSGTR